MPKQKPVDKVSLHSFPNVKESEFKALLERRRCVWLERTKFTEDKLLLSTPSAAVCGRHFILGKPSYPLESKSLDWAPTQLIGKVYISVSAAKCFQKRKTPSEPKAIYVPRTRKNRKVVEGGEVQETLTTVAEKDSETLNIGDSSEEDTTSSLLAKVDQLTKRNQELELKIEELERQLNQCSEKALQSEKIESTFKAMEEEIKYLKNKLLDKNHKLVSFAKLDSKAHCIL